jgi:hypothetical protein
MLPAVYICLRAIFLLALHPGAAVFFGERINALAGQHWEAFAGQHYFDSHGIFYSIMVSGPAVFNLFAVLVSSASALASALSHVYAPAGMRHRCCCVA